MILKKPKFWDDKKPNFISYFLLPLTYLISLINFLYKTKKIKSDKIKTICVGNIYIGGTGKTPVSIKLKKILDNLNFKTAFIKKDYIDQIDEQKILSLNGELFCKKNREDALKDAINQNFEVAIFDDGLQDRKLKYDLSFVCFNIQAWIGNGLCIPSGPLRENLKSLKKYDAIFLNGNNENTIEIENIIKNIKPNLRIFKTIYVPSNIETLDLNHNYISFSGIGNPDNFLKTLKKNKFKIVRDITFPDHYNYSNKDILKIKDMAKNLNARIITTEKDYSRLDKNQSEEINCLKIKLNILNEIELIDFINKKL
tara:strand:+ start:1235 stop:2170 length:936 start_codon:yes stop_codon:yes gene_type:complete